MSTSSIGLQFGSYREYLLTEKYGTIVPKARTQKPAPIVAKPLVNLSFKLTTNNPNKVNFGDIANFNYREVVIKKNNKKAVNADTPKKEKKAKQPQGKGKKGKGTKTETVKSDAIDVVFEPKPKKERKIAVRTHVSSNVRKKAPNKNVFREFLTNGDKNYRVEAAPMDTELVLKEVIWTFAVPTPVQHNAPGVDLANRKAKRTERNAKRLANKELFTTLNVVKLLHRVYRAASSKVRAAFRKASVFMDAARANYDVAGSTLVMSANKEQQQVVTNTGVPLNIVSHAIQLGAVPLSSMANDSWNGSNQNYFMAICAGHIDSTKAVSFNSPLGDGLEKDRVTPCPNLDLPHGRFGITDFNAENLSMGGASPVCYVPLRTPCSPLVNGSTIYSKGWSDIVGFTQYLGLPDSTTQQYQIYYNSHYSSYDIDANDFVITSDYGTDKLEAIPGTVVKNRHSLHELLYNRMSKEEETAKIAKQADQGNVVRLQIPVSEWIANNPSTLVYPSMTYPDASVGFFLVIGVMNDISKASVKEHKKGNASHIRLLCDKVYVLGIRYEDLGKFVSHQLKPLIDTSKSYWRMGFFTWAYEEFKKHQVTETPVATIPTESIMPPMPADLLAKVQATLSPIGAEATIPQEAIVTTQPASIPVVDVVTATEVVPIAAELPTDVTTIAAELKVLYTQLGLKPRTNKVREATTEQLESLCTAFTEGDSALVNKLKEVHKNITPQTIKDITDAKANKSTFLLTYYYYVCLAGRDVSKGDVYDIKFEWEDLVRLVKSIRTLYKEQVAENTHTDKNIDEYLTLVDVDASTHILYLQGTEFRFKRYIGEILVSDARGRMFNKTAVIKMNGKDKVKYEICSAFDNFMRLFYIGIIPLLTDDFQPYLPKAHGENVTLFINNMSSVSMSKDEIASQNGGEVYSQASMVHPVIWEELPVSHKPYIEHNATKLVALYAEKGKQLNSYKVPKGKDKTESPVSMLGLAAYKLHKDHNIAIHFAKKVGMNGSISAVNLFLAADLAPTLFQEIVSFLGWDQGSVESIRLYYALANSIKTEKLAKRLTLALTSAVTMSRISQLVQAGWRLAGQLQPINGLLREVVLAPGLVCQPGMLVSLGLGNEVVNISFKKEEYFLKGSFTISTVTGHPFSFDDSDVEGMSDTEWTIVGTTTKGWTQLIPNKELTVYGGETICRTIPEGNIPLDGRGFLKHDSDVEGVITSIEWKQDADMAAGEKLSVRYVLCRDVTEFKLRNAFVKANEMHCSDNSLYFNTLNGNEGNAYPVSIITQDTAKLDVIWWTMSLIADTVNNPANWDTSHPVFQKLLRLVVQYTNYTPGNWSLGQPILILPDLIYASKTVELVEYFQSVFGKANWFVWKNSAPMANKMYKLYYNQVVAGKWHNVTSGTVFDTINDYTKPEGTVHTVVFSQDVAITYKTNILCFWLDANGKALGVAQRTMTWQSAQGLHLSTVLAVETSTVLENVGISNVMPMSISALSALIADPDRCNAIQNAAMSHGDKDNYRIAALAQMVGGGDFSMTKFIRINFDKDKLYMHADDRKELKLLLEDVIASAKVKRGNHFADMCEGMQTYCIIVQYKEGKYFTVWMPALLLFSQMKSTGDTSNNFVSCFYYDILLPTAQGLQVLTASASSCHGMMSSLLGSENFLKLFKGPKAATGKRISTPEIPVGELWVLESNFVNSEYVNLKRCGYPLDSINSTHYNEDDVDVIYYVCRAPIALGAILRVRVIVESIVDGKKVQYAMPIPSDTPEQAAYWLNNPIVYHMTTTQLGQNCDSVYGSDVGDHDGDGVNAAVLKGLTTDDVMTSNKMVEIQTCYIGMSPYDANNKQYIGDHFAIKGWDKAMIIALDVPAASGKALQSYETFAEQSKDAMDIIVSGVGVEYRVYATCDIVVQIIMTAARHNIVLESVFNQLLEDEPQTLVLNSGAVYEYMLGGYSDAARKLYKQFLKPIMDGELAADALYKNTDQTKTESDLYHVIQDVGASTSRIKQIALMMGMIAALYGMKKGGDDVIVYDAANPLGCYNTVLLSAHCIFEMSRNKFKGYAGALPIPSDDDASQMAKAVDRNAFYKLCGLLEWCRINAPQVIADCFYLQTVENTLMVIGNEMLGKVVKGDMWNPHKLYTLGQHAGIKLNAFKQRSTVVIAYTDTKAEYEMLCDINPVATAKKYAEVEATGSFVFNDYWLAPVQAIWLLNQASNLVSYQVTYVLAEDNNGGEEPTEPVTPTEPTQLEVEPLTKNEYGYTLQITEDSVIINGNSFPLVKGDYVTYTKNGKVTREVVAGHTTIFCGGAYVGTAESNGEFYLTKGGFTDHSEKLWIDFIQEGGDLAECLESFDLIAYDINSSSHNLFVVGKIVTIEEEQTVTKPTVQTILDSYQTANLEKHWVYGEFSHYQVGPYRFEDNVFVTLNAPICGEVDDLVIFFVNVGEEMTLEMQEQYNHTLNEDPYLTSTFFFHGKTVDVEHENEHENEQPKQTEVSLPEDKTVYYAGIGKREGVPTEVAELINRIVAYKAAKGEVLRSGSAAGCDTLFENAAIKHNAPFISYLPWNGFNGRNGGNYMSQYDPTIWAYATQYVKDVLGEAHWNKLTQGMQKLHTRNAFQVLGHDLKTPVWQVVCWTPNGATVGGTATAIKIAEKHGIPVINLGNPKTFATIKKILDDANVMTEQPEIKPAEVVKRGPGALLVQEPGLYAQQGLLNYFSEEEFNSLFSSVLNAYQAGQKQAFSQNGYQYTCCGDYYWVWNKGNAQYLTRQPNGGDIVAMPADLADIATRLVKYVLGLYGDTYQTLIDEFVPEVALINKYEAGQTLNPHIDKSEENMSAPIVSLSFGAEGVFSIAGKDLLLDNGAVCLFWGEQRKALHGYKGNVTEGTRYNVTIRMVNKPKQVEQEPMPEPDYNEEFSKRLVKSDLIIELDDKGGHLTYELDGHKFDKSNLSSWVRDFSWVCFRFKENNTSHNVCFVLEGNERCDEMADLVNGILDNCGHGLSINDYFDSHTVSLSGKKMHTTLALYHGQIIYKKPETTPVVESVAVTPGQVMYIEHITREYVQQNSNQFFVFGDNFERTGLGGQAKEMRGEPNTIGIATKLKPTNNPDAFLTDAHYEMFKAEIDSKFLTMQELITKGHDIIFPAKGIGTGLSNLAATSPACWTLLKTYMQSCGLPGYDTPVVQQTVEVTPEVVIETPVSNLTEEACFAAIMDIAKARGKKVDADKVLEILRQPNDEQKQVVYSFFIEKSNTFLTGEGGAGKTYTTCVIRSLLDLLSYPYLHLGSTGISVMNVEGHGTLNSKFGLGLGMQVMEGKGRNARARKRKNNELYELSYYEQLVRECRSYLRDKWGPLVTQANNMPIVIYIEEISMIGSLLLSSANEALDKENIKVQWFTSGDLCQAGAVDDYAIFKDGTLSVLKEGEVTEMVKQTIFNKDNFKFINLLGNMRSTNQDWTATLQQLRLGVGSRYKSVPKGLKAVWDKSVEAAQQGTMPTDNVVHLCATNYTAKRINQTKIDELKKQHTQSKWCNAKVSTKRGAPSNWHQELFNPIEEKMWLCVGMRVMLRYNMKENDMLLAGNGSCGFVTGFSGDFVKVKFDNGVELPIKPQKLGNNQYDELGTYTQIPLHPCYAITITKAQGLTLPGNVIIHPYMEYKKNSGEVVVQGIFLKNALYVAASRCPSTENLYFWTQIPDNNLVDSSGNYDYASAYRYLLNSYVCDHEAAEFVKKHIIGQH